MKNKIKRVVITGLGIISSIGNNQNEVLYSLQNGISGISFSKKLKKFGIRSHVWGDIKIDIQKLIDYKIKRFMNNSSIYAYLAMKQAIEHAKLSPTLVSNHRTGLIIGNAINCSQNNTINLNKQNRKIKNISPFSIIKSMNSNISACLTIPFNIKGISYSISSACATSAHCIGNAFEIIQSNKQDIIFAGGAEEICVELAHKFDSIGVLSTKYNNTPTQTPRAYDINRDGFVISGGGGVIVLEELQHAKTRLATIYAEIIGYGASSDGVNMVIPSGYGAIRCMQIALKHVKKPIDYINTHGTSTILGDIIELWAIKKVFNNYDNQPALSSTKSMTGHALGASGVHEIIYALLMMQHNFIAPSINITNLDPKIKNKNIITNMVKKKLNTIMSNSFGFGGTNATLILQKYN